MGEDRCMGIMDGKGCGRMNKQLAYLQCECAGKSLQTK